MEQIDFNSARSSSLDIALSSRQRLQNALDSGKHGITNSNVGSATLTIRELLYSNISDTKTVAIDHDTSRLLVLYKWHSLATVKLVDVFESMQKNGDVVIRLSKLKLDLQVITVADVVKGLAAYVKDVVVSAYDEEGYIVFSKCPPDVLSRIVRRTILDCNIGDLEVIGEVGTIFTLLKGNKFENAMMHADVTLSTNVEITTAYVGRVNAAILYNKYITCYGKELQLANIFCSNVNECNTYSSISKSAPLKRMSVRSQVDTLTYAALEGDIDNLQTYESRLMVGANVGDRAF